MREFHPFVMERWQSTYENRVERNLSESGVHPLTVAGLLDMAGDTIRDTLIGYGQSNGSDSLRQTIASLYSGASTDHVCVGNGSAEINFVSLWTLLEPGTSIAILSPTYMQAAGLARNMAVEVREIPLREDAGWQPDPADIAAAVTSNTRVIVVTNPGNPTGTVLSAESRAALILAADRVGAWILADEVYAGAELDGPRTPSFRRTAGIRRTDLGAQGLHDDRARRTHRQTGDNRSLASRTATHPRAYESPYPCRLVDHTRLVRPTGLLHVHDARRRRHLLGPLRSAHHVDRTRRTAARRAQRPGRSGLPLRKR